jgi:hypothetical protein
MSEPIMLIIRGGPDAVTVTLAIAKLKNKSVGALWKASAKKVKAQYKRENAFLPFTVYPKFKYISTNSIPDHTV